MGTLCDVIFIGFSHNVSFFGKAWWLLLVLGRGLVPWPAALSLFGDEHDHFVCNTLQPGCSNVCLDVFAPVSLFRLWLFQLIFLGFPQILFLTYVAHKSNAAPEWRTRSFRRFSVGAIVLRILVEVMFAAGQFLLFGASFPKSVMCYEAPCSSGVECYVSRPTEKTLMLRLMLALAFLSILLSLLDLAGSVNSVTRRKKRMKAKRISKEEQSSIHTATVQADGLLIQRTSPSRSSRSGHGRLHDKKVARTTPGVNRSLQDKREWV
ncbi:gap junction gamma-2 protein-like [Hippocampus comes]|uniref:gap junction gamma-2 protein-like n=1 Tax=Hippocampus comes TaxID=109280 RepID=UPI00094EE254|nr:PREDICTED: gap junction gamma-2 protein-like [Hippocampus comes]